MQWLAPLKVLRGTPFDPFGWSHERRQERALREDFFGTLDEVVQAATPANLSDLLAILTAPDAVRGYGHIKAANIETYRVELQRLRFKAGLGSTS